MFGNGRIVLLLVFNLAVLAVYFFARIPNRYFYSLRSGMDLSVGEAVNVSVERSVPSFLMQVLNVDLASVQALFAASVFYVNVLLFWLTLKIKREVSVEA